ncbi:MAG: arginine--tRNA ligase [Clostridia bacterium]|nr:arginine--tRNA ligase [Clostridia bacterium]
MTLYESTTSLIKKVTDEAINSAKEKAELEISEVCEYLIEEPRDKKNGDFSVNAAMVMSRQVKRAPREVAEILVSNMKKEGTYISDISVAGPGFINFKLDPVYVTEILKTIEEEKDSFGKTDFGGGKKVNVEFVSANPTGPMHMGNARGGALGDCLANIMSLAGFDVTKEFYVNDAGNQIEKLAVSLAARYKQIVLGEDAVEFPEDGYHGDDVKEHAKKFYDANGDKFISVPEEELKNALIDATLYKNIDAMKDGLKAYGINYDVWFHESELHNKNDVLKTVEELTKNGYTYEKEGAIWFKATEFGLEKDDVLVRANGFVTYFAADIAYHKNKFIDRSFDTAIDIWGADHHGHVARLKAAMKALGIEPDRLEIVLMQLVRLVRDGEAVRMSKRTGKAITLGDLLEEIGVDAARFFFNMRQANSHFEFDLELAVSQSSDNPVFYVQYAHARICGIIKMLMQKGVSVKNCDELNLSLLNHEREIELMKEIAKFPEEIKYAAQNRDPSRITKYTMDLASAFHSFYGACKVDCEDKNLQEARLKLVDATGKTIKNALTVLGITAPEHM